MAVLIDSDVIIQAERGLFDFEGWLVSLPQEEFKLAAITFAELWHGAERATGAHRVKRQLFLERLFATFECVPYDQSIAFEHARLWAELESLDQMIGSYDLILAATALKHGHAVATYNTRHFAAVPRLKVIQPG